MWRWLAPIAALLLLAGGFLLGRATEGSQETTATTGTKPNDTRGAVTDGIAGHVDPEDVVKVFPPQIVQDGDIAAEKKGTPERAFLEWWQAWQYHDAAAVERLTSPATVKAVGEENLAKIVGTLTLPGVEILGATESGSSASVEAGLLTFTPPAEGKPPPNKPTNSQPDTFAMAMEHGDWLFDDAEFLQLKVNAIQQQ